MTDVSRTRVLVVDASMVMCHLVAQYLSATDDLTVVGVARDFNTALDLAKAQRPDVVTIDSLMPQHLAISIISGLLAEQPIRVVIVSTGPENEARSALRGLAIGAVEYVAKPGLGPGEHRRMGRDVVAAVRRSAAARRRAIPPPTMAPESVAITAPAAEESSATAARAPSEPATRLVVLGASTGGPAALRALVPKLSARLDAAFIVIQHMPQSFTRSLAKRLNAECQLSVREAEEGDRLLAGVALMAPGDYHLVIDEAPSVHLTHDPPVHGVRPALDVTLESAAAAFGRNLLAVVLTGMGVDGARGAAMVKRHGGTVFAQDESTSVVYGMPRAVVEQGACDRVVPLSEMSEVISSWIQAKERSSFRRTTPMKMPATR